MAMAMATHQTRRGLLDAGHDRAERTHPASRLSDFRGAFSFSLASSHACHASDRAIAPAPIPWLHDYSLDRGLAAPPLDLILIFFFLFFYFKKKKNKKRSMYLYYIYMTVTLVTLVIW